MKLNEKIFNTLTLYFYTSLFRIIEVCFSALVHYIYEKKKLSIR